MSRHTASTLGAALLGLCLAVGLAILTSGLTTQQVGLAGESPRSGLRLVAPRPSPAKPRRRPREKHATARRPGHTQTVTVVRAPPVSPAAPVAPPAVVTPAPARTVVVPAPQRPTVTPGGREDNSHTTSSNGTQGHRDD